MCSSDLHIAGLKRQLDIGQVSLRVQQQLGILLKTQARRLFLELELGDALAQGVKLAFQLQAALVAGAQLGGQIVILTALGAQVGFPLELDVQRVLQPALRRGIGQA